MFGNAMVKRLDLIDHSSGDYPRWIDTSVMLADPLTKTMNADRLIHKMTSGRFDLQPTPESLAIKAKNRLLRSSSRASEQCGTEH